MLRCTLRVLCWLALGAVVNVGVAWWPAIHRCQPIPGNASYIETWVPSRYDPTNYPPPHSLWADNGWLFDCRVAEWNWAEGRPIVSVQVYEVGLPLRSLRCARVDGLTLTTWQDVAVQPRARFDGKIPCALRPCGFGFMFNTLFYALPIAVLWLAPGQLRRWHRRRHGHCIHCCYPVGDPAKPCSECGRSPTTR